MKQTMEQLQVENEALKKAIISLAAAMPNPPVVTVEPEHQAPRIYNVEVGAVHEEVGDRMARALETILGAEALPTYMKGCQCEYCSARTALDEWYRFRPRSAR